MSTSEFRRLADELVAAHGGKAAGVGSPSDDARSGIVALDVEGVKVLLCETQPSNRGAGAVLCADCGEIPPRMQADVMERVLAMNLLLYRDNGATFCLDALTRHLLLLANVRPETATPTEVLDMARQFARGVRDYEANHFGASGGQDVGAELFGVKRA